VSTLKKWVGGIFVLGLGGFVGLFFAIDTRIETRFDKLDGPIDQLQISASGQTATLDAINERLARMEQRDDGRRR
jgi:hypothetical protein